MEKIKKAHIAESLDFTGGASLIRTGDLRIMILQKMLFRNVDLCMTRNKILFIFNSLNEYRTFPILISVD